MLLFFMLGLFEGKLSILKSRDRFRFAVLVPCSEFDVAVAENRSRRPIPSCVIHVENFTAIHRCASLQIRPNFLNLGGIEPSWTQYRNRNNTILEDVVRKIRITNRPGRGNISH